MHVSIERAHMLRSTLARYFPDMACWAVGERGVVVHFHAYVRMRESCVEEYS